MLFFYIYLLLRLPLYSESSCNDSGDLHFKAVEEEKFQTVLDSTNDASATIISTDHNGPCDAPKYFSYSNRELSTLKFLDYEACSFFKFYLVGEGQKVVTVCVSVVDINDNPPSFAEKLVVLEVSERAPIQSKYSFPAANDKDSPKFSILKYEILKGDDGSFKLLVRSAAQTLELEVVKALDRDSEPSTRYLQIEAVDGGGLSDILNVTIHLLDANDNIPVFALSNYTAFVNSNASFNDTVLNVHAVDIDSGAFGKVSYAFKTNFSIFAINSETGRVYLLTNPEPGKTYSNIVVAMDDGGGPNSNKAEVLIQITIESSSAFRISTTMLPDSIRENVEPGYFGRFSVLIGQQKLISNQIKVTLSDYHSGIFQLGPLLFKDFRINTAHKIDYEKIKSITLKIVATALPNSTLVKPGSSSSSTVVIEVIDLNDNAPEFSELEGYYVTLEDGMLKGTVLCNISASDKDADGNSVITYSLLTPSQLFDFSSIDLQVRLTKEFDCETNLSSVHNLTIQAQDDGNPILTTTTNVFFIIVDNRNEFPPRFVNPVNELSVLENVPENHCFYQFTAEDPDCQSNPITYSFSPLQAFFSIDYNTGEVCTNGLLDFEDGVNIFEFLLIANDSFYATTLNLTLAIQNANDHRPVFSLESNDIFIDWQLPSESLIYVIFAEDIDSGVYGKVEYFMIEGNDDVFSLNTSSGEVFLKSSLEGYIEPMYLLVFGAIDGGQMMAEFNASIFVYINGYNDEPPVFEESFYSFSVDENSNSGYPIGKVLAKNPLNSVSNAPITYTVNEAGCFSVNNSTGELYVSCNLDAEFNRIYHFYITAHSLRPLAQSYAAVEVTVNDLDDNLPGFKSFLEPITVNVYSTTDLPLFLFTVKAYDEDSLPLIYDFVSQQSLISINSTTGVVTLDVLPTASITLNVEIQVRGTTIGMTTVTEIYFHEDPNIEFVLKHYTFDVFDNTSISDVIGQFSLISDYDGEILLFSKSFTFFVTPSCEIFLSEEVTIGQYAFTIVAEVPLFNFTNEVGVSILVHSGTEPVPQFGKSEYYTAIGEEVFYQSVEILKVKAYAQNPDEGVSYELFNATDAFTIDTDGVIRVTNAVFDREYISQYHFFVIANVNAVQNSAAVTVDILDVNDNPPVFPYPEYNCSLYYDVPPYTPILLLLATDADNVGSDNITYNFKNDAPPGLSLASSTGLLSSTDRLQQSYLFEVVASDGKNEAKTTVRITRLFSKQPILATCLTFVLPVNTSVGTVFGKVSPTNVSEHYRYFASSLAEFNVDYHTGELTVKKPLNDRPSVIQLSVEHILNPNNRTEADVSIVKDNIAGAFEDDLEEVKWFDIPEDYAINIPVVRIKSMNIPAKAVKYEIMVQTQPARFTIDSSTGIISLTDHLDYEKFVQSSLFISAVEEGVAYPINGTLTVIFQIIDVNDNQPEFVMEEFAVLENTPKGSVVFRIVANDKDQKNNGEISFQIVGGTGQDVFRIDPETGKVVLVQDLDRETQDSYTLTVKAFDHGTPRLSSSHTFFINIANVNDHGPKFSEEIYRGEIFENASIGTTVLKVSATDMDSVDSEYSIETAIDAFVIDSKTGVISTNALLDRESRSSYEFTVTARDHDSQDPLTGTAKASITIRNVDDEKPFFPHNPQEIKVYENQRPGVIHTFQAIDRDNGTLYYSIISPENPLFTINRNTGALSPIDSLDRESSPNHTLTIRVTDSAGHTADVKAIVHVLDRNDNPPIITMDSRVIDVKEFDYTGDVIFEITAYDPDEGYNAEVSFKLVDSPPSINQTFSVDSTSGVVSVHKRLDHEKQATYDLQFIVTDMSRTEKRLSSSINITINVFNINENKPFFNQTYWVHHPSLSANAPVIKVHGYDKDKHQGFEQVLNYSLVDTFKNTFNIDRLSGEITTLKAINQQSRFLLRVLVTDYNFKINATSTGIVDLSVGPLNPPRLKFPAGVFEATIDENAKAGTKVQKLRLEDESITDVTYTIMDYSEYPSFYISGDTVRVMNNTLLDYELQHSIVIIVNASKDGMFGYSIIHVNLRNLNDNPPQVMKERMKIAVSEALEPNLVIGLIQAVDPDSNSPESINYTVISVEPPSPNLFRVNSFGVLTNLQVLNREKVAKYRIKVRVSDIHILPIRHTDVIVDLTIKDMNDNPPRFHNVTPVEISESLPLRSVVTKVKFSDPDSSDAPNLKVSITNLREAGVDNVFSIDPTTGDVLLLKKLDYEKQQKYILDLSLTDGAFTVTTQLIIFVTDANDNPPKFKKKQLFSFVPEFVTANQTLFVAKATDADSSRYGKITYRISDYDHGFKIDPHTGAVASKTDKLLARDVELLIEAKDGGDPPLTSTTFLVLQVKHSNEPPKFPQNVIEVSIKENVRNSPNIVSVVATDPDRPNDNLNIEYRLLGKNTNFSIYSEVKKDIRHAYVMANGELDYEYKSQYNLTLMAKEKGVNGLNSTVLIIVNVLDVNDNAPVFSSNKYRKTVCYCALPGELIGQVKAYDVDVNDTLTYRFSSSKNEFEINPKTGWISVKNINTSKKRERRMIVEAYDSYHIARATLTIAIDFKQPTIQATRLHYDFQTKEEGPVGLLVGGIQLLEMASYHYSNFEIISDDPNLPFFIESKSGKIHSDQQLDYEKKQYYDFIVRIVNLEFQKVEIFVSVNITIISEDEYLPVFDRPYYKFSINANAELDSSIGRVKATDRDFGVHGVVYYYFMQNYSNFRINSLTGEISLSSSLLTNHDWIPGNNNSTHRQKRQVNNEHIANLIVKAASSPTAKAFAMTEVHIEVLVACCREYFPQLSISSPEVNNPLDGIVLALIIVAAVLAMVVFVICVFAFMFRKTKPTSVRSESPRSYGTGRMNQYTGPITAPLEKDEQLRRLHVHLPQHIGAENYLLSFNNEIARMGDSGFTEFENSSEFTDENLSEDEEGHVYASASVESMHTFCEEGGGERRGPERNQLEVGNMIYAKLHEMGGNEFIERLSGDLSNSYNWNYLMHWAPQYQPLAEVFDGIGKFKDDSSSCCQPSPRVQTERFPQPIPGLESNHSSMDASRRPAPRTVPGMTRNSNQAAQNIPLRPLQYTSGASSANPHVNNRQNLPRTIFNGANPV